MMPPESPLSPAPGGAPPQRPSGRYRTLFLVLGTLIGLPMLLVVAGLVYGLVIWPYWREYTTVRRQRAYSEALERMRAAQNAYKAATGSFAENLDVLAAPRPTAEDAWFHYTTDPRHSCALPKENAWAADKTCIDHAGNITYNKDSLDDLMPLLDEPNTGWSAGAPTGEGGPTDAEMDQLLKQLEAENSAPAGSSGGDGGDGDVEAEVEVEVPPVEPRPKMRNPPPR